MSTTSEVSAVVHQVNNNNDVRDGNKTLFVLGEKTDNDVNIPTKLNISPQNPRSKKRKIVDDMHVYINIFNFFTELRIQIKDPARNNKV